MKKLSIILVVAVMCLFVGGVRLAAQTPQGTAGTSGGAAASSSRGSRLNPVHWFKRTPKTATERLTANSEEDKKLTSALRMQGVLPKGTDLRDACSTFKELDDCVAALHASHNLKLSFSCLKWDVTGVEARGHAPTCKGPGGEKRMSLSKAIHLLKPDANAKAEAKQAEKQARNDLLDASS